MPAIGVDAIERFRQPEYTGENRCLPCTVVNVGIAATLSAVVWFLLTPAAAVVAFVLLLGVVYLRGYLVPGTPTLTERYLPKRVLRVFHEEEFPRAELLRDPTEIDEPIDVESWLVDSEILLERGDGDLRIDDEFRRRWERKIETSSEDDVEIALASALGVDRDRIDFLEHEGKRWARVDGSIGRKWISRPAYVADVIAVDALADAADGWDDLNLDEQWHVAKGVRSFLDSCPDCGGRLERAKEITETCCSTSIKLRLVCPGCETTIKKVHRYD